MCVYVRYVLNYGTSFLKRFLKWALNLYIDGTNDGKNDVIHRLNMVICHSYDTSPGGKGYVDWSRSRIVEFLLVTCPYPCWSYHAVCPFLASTMQFLLCVWQVSIAPISCLYIVFPCSCRRIDGPNTVDEVFGRYVTPTQF